MQEASRRWKGKEINSLLEPPQRNSVWWHTDLAQWDLLWTCALQNHKIIHLCGVKRVVLCYSSNRSLIHIGIQVVPPWSSYVQYKREAFPCLTGWGAVTQASKVDLRAMDPHHWTRGSLGRRRCSLCRGHRRAGSRHSHKAQEWLTTFQGTVAQLETERGVCGSWKQTQHHCVHCFMFSHRIPFILNFK